MKIKFLADENLRRAILNGVRQREPSADFVSAFEIGATAKDDFTVLRITAAEGRVLISHGIKTLPSMFRQFTSTGTSPGIILIS